tara:strand:+ start:861 stop:1052 length:192 start_codon:yes stop_codon:yes gene_type:complete
MEGDIGEVHLKVCEYKFGNEQAAYLSPPIIVTALNGIRASGFPEMKKQRTEHGNELVFVYTHL